MPMRLMRVEILSTLPLEFWSSAVVGAPFDRWAKITHQMVNNVLTTRRETQNQAKAA
jgi:hypothetical protein